MIRMLVSVRSAEEALLAARHGAHFIDCKEPGQGPLGGLPPQAISAIVAALRQARCSLPVSATIGDLPMNALAAIAERVRAVAACRVDYVKVGIERGPGALRLLDALAALDHPIVPVFIADRGLDFDALAHACDLRFPALMLDTADKLAGSLFDALPYADIMRFVAAARAAGALAGLAGALRAAQVPALQALAPDFAGFRTAVCAAGRASALDPACLQALAARMQATG